MRVFKIIIGVIIVGMLFGEGVIRTAMVGVEFRSHTWNYPLTRIEARTSDDNGFVYLVGSSSGNDTFSFFRARWKSVELKTFTCNSGDAIKKFQVIEQSPFVYLLISTKNGVTDTLMRTKWSSIQFSGDTLGGDSVLYGFRVSDIGQYTTLIPIARSQTSVEEQTPVAIDKFGVLSVYPQPSYDVVNVKLAVPDRSSIGFVIYDVTGRMIKNWNVNAGEKIYTLTLSQNYFPHPGVYFLKVNYMDNHLIKKIIILK